MPCSSSIKTILFLLLPLLVSGPARPQPAALAARYDLRWNGLSAGSMDLAFARTAGAYTLDLSFSSGGIVGLFVNAQSTLTAEGRLTDQGLAPRQYRFDTYWGGQHYARHVMFNAAGRVRRVQWDWPDGETPPDRTPVPDRHRRAPDPITIIAAMMVDQWKLLQTANGSGTARTTSYDGARSLAYAIMCKARIAIDRDMVPADRASPCVLQSTLTGGVPREDIYQGRAPRDRETAELLLAPLDGPALFVPMAMDISFAGRMVHADLTMLWRPDGS